MALAGTVILIKDHTLFRALSHTFAQAQMSSEENELQYVHSDILWETQPFRFRLHEREKSGTLCTVVFILSLIDCNFSPLDLSPLDLQSKYYFCPGSMRFHRAKLKAFSWGHKLPCSCPRLASHIHAYYRMRKKAHYCFCRLNLRRLGA